MGVPHAAYRAGQTRCYWALLTADLCFLYIDPVLADHLDEQAEQLIGRPLLSFVHPQEQASAEHDLGRVLESRTLHGSVTRVRYARLSSMRRRLGYKHPEALQDDDYLAADIVINWAADGLVLCFIHALDSLSPLDNDEQQRTDWSNWCGTPHMSMEQVQLLYQRIMHSVPASGNSARVFQLLWNTPDRSLVISWPPSQPSQPTAGELAKLAEDVQIGSHSSDAKTSCTRRYKALRGVSNGTSEVESIFIPYGSVIFTCHKIEPMQPRSLPEAAPYSQSQYGTGSLDGSQPFYDSGSSQYGLPQSSYGAGAGGYTSQQSWNRADAPSSASQYAQWSHGMSGPQMSTSSHLRHSSSYSSVGSQPWPPSTSAYGDGMSSIPYARTASPHHAYPDSSTEGGSSNDGDSVVPLTRGAPRRTSPPSNRDNYGGGGRSAGCPPVGVPRCSSCKVTHSPEWRKGPSGKKDLCNACGLRYARSRAKKEGLTPVRRRKQSNPVKQEDTSAVAPSLASSSSAGQSPTPAPSGSSVSGYAHGSGYDGSTPSPSPPSTQVDFGNSRGGGGHYSYGTQPEPPYGSSYPPSGYHQSSLSNQYLGQPPPLGGPGGSMRTMTSS